MLKRLTINKPETCNDDNDGDRGDGGGDTARSPSFSPILVDSFKCQYGSRRQQLWLCFAFVGRALSSGLITKPHTLNLDSDTLKLTYVYTYIYIRIYIYIYIYI